MSESGHHKQGPAQGRDQQGHSSYWRFAHHDWRFWVGLILIFTAMFIYLMTEDLSWRPGIQLPQTKTGSSLESNKVPENPK